jgi:hypothetical protein
MSFEGEFIMSNFISFISGYYADLFNYLSLDSKVYGAIWFFLALFIIILMLYIRNSKKESLFWQKVFLTIGTSISLTATIFEPKYVNQDSFAVSREGWASVPSGMWHPSGVVSELESDKCDYLADDAVKRYQVKFTAMPPKPSEGNVVYDDRSELCSYIVAMYENGREKEIPWVEISFKKLPSPTHPW